MPTEFGTSSVTGQPAFNEFGLTSLQNMAKDKVVEETTKFGLGTLMQGLGPAYAFYSVLDALGFFDSGMEATPMTPEERELFNAAQKVDMAVDLAQKASTGDVDTEGLAPEAHLLDAYETVSALPDSDLEFFGNTKNQLLDALETQTAQNMLLGLTPGQAVGSVLNTPIPGVTDIPVMGPLFEGAMDKVAETVDDALGYIGMGDIRGDVVFGPGGATVKFEPKTTKRTPTQKGVSPQGTSGSPNGSTATATTGSREGDLILNGGTLGGVIDTEMGGEGEYSAVEILHDSIALTCKSNETYDRATFSCIPQSGPKPPAKIICPSEYEKAGDEVDSLKDCGEEKSTSTITTEKTTKTCWDGSEIAVNADCPPSKTCWDGSEIAVNADCPPSKTCWDGSVIAIDANCPPSKICPDNTEKGGQEIGVNDSCGKVTPPPDPCLNPAYAAENPVECGTPPTDPCLNPAYAAENPEICGTKTDPCLNPAYAAENPEICGTKTDPCLNPAYAAANPEICGGQPPPPEDPCDNPAYAAENPEICGGQPPPPPDPCDDPAYAAENPVECGTPPTDPCLNPAYAAENPVECGTVRIIECPPNSDKPGRAVPTGQTVQSFCYEGAPPPPEDPCLNPAYAAENPIECGTKTDPCLDADYAAANPEKCGVDTDPCNNIAYALLNPEICAPTPSTAGLMPTIDGRMVRVEPGELANIEYLYDIGGESIFAPTIQAASGGKIDNYDLLREVEDLLRGR